MKIVCSRCKGKAELTDDFSRVKCSTCRLDVTYAEYLDMDVQKTLSARDSDMNF